MRVGAGVFQVDAQLVEGMVAMKSPGTWSAAEALFTKVIQAAPEFAEGYNKRATVMYMRHDYTAAIKDCKTTGMPRVFGPLARNRLNAGRRMFFFCFRRGGDGGIHFIWPHSGRSAALAA